MNRIKRFFVFALAAMLIMSLVPTPSSAAGTFLSKTYNGRTYKIYVPQGYQTGTSVPLIVMLHGCTQDPDQF